MTYQICSICNAKGKLFLPLDKSLAETLKNHKFPYLLKDFETLSPKKYLCSNCAAPDRDRLYKIYIDKYLKPQKKIDLVDFAPSEPLRKVLKNKKNINYRSADLFMEDVDDKIDITNMSAYADESFDFFICSHVLEHVDSDAKALKELYRILKRGGKGILMTPIITKKGVFDEDPKEKAVAERWRRFGQDDHVRLYEKGVFLKRVKAAGFTIQEYGFKQLGRGNLIRNGIRLKSKLYIVSKEE